VPIPNAACSWSVDSPLGTHDRFIGFLIEHYAGNFPLWLAPEHVLVARDLGPDPINPKIGSARICDAQPV
jgi:hypothetical protein